MRILRNQLVDHLQRIMCGGAVKEVIFTGAFEARALTTDHQLLVIAPPLEGATELAPEPIGIGNLERVVRALSFIAGDGDELADVDVSFDPDVSGARCLVIDESARSARVTLITANPRTITTRVEPATVEQILAGLVTDGAGHILLDAALVDDVQRAFSGLNAETVVLSATPDGGIIRVGGGNSDGAEFFSGALTVAPDQPEVTLTFGANLIGALKAASSNGVDDVTLRLPLPNGPRMIAIEGAGFSYLLSTQSAPAGQKTKSAVKARGSKSAAL
jgi:hypothetical protein